MASYNDSAIAYNYTIEQVNVGENYMRVLYQSADSTDGRPDLRQNYYVSVFTDSDLKAVATSQINVEQVVGQWNSYLATESDASAFNVDSFIGSQFSDNYYPFQYDSFPSYNPNTSKVTSSTSLVGNRNVVSYTVSAMSDSEKADYRSRLSSSLFGIRQGLIDLGKYDSVVSVISTVDSNFVEWEHGDGVSYTDPISDEIRTVTGYADDSDWGQFLSDNP